METKKAEKEIKKILQKFIDFKKHQVFIFGSRAMGQSRKFSDYDIGILGKKSVALRDLALIDEELEESNLPYRVEVVDFATVSKDFKKIALKKIKRL